MAEHRHGEHAPDAAHAAHEPGSMDIAEHRRMFEAFIRFWVLVFGVSAAILIFLALFNS
jgi:hypothetical protein